MQFQITKKLSINENTTVYLAKAVWEFCRLPLLEVQEQIRVSVWMKIHSLLWLMCHYYYAEDTVGEGLEKNGFSGGFNG